MADTSGLPNDLVEVVKSLHERVQQMADHRIDRAQQEFIELNEELRKKLDDSSNTIAQLNARQKDLETQIGQRIDEVNQKAQTLEDIHIKLTRAELQRDEAITRAAELKENITELKQENRDIRDHFEHYQQRTSEDRQQEREQFRAANQGLKDQIQDLQHRLAQAESRASELIDDNALLQRNADELKQANAALNSDLKGKIEDIQNLNHELEETVTKCREYQHKYDQFAENIAVLTTQKTDVDKQVAVLTQALETTKAELKTTQDKLAFLTDENKVILQEKAVIQGQFKQLQESL
jgi:chromosome segregation ATPase